MGIQEVITFANANKVAYMATMDGTQPRVRAFDMWKADETGFYFHNNATKGVHDQLQLNKNVELFIPSRDGGRQALRVLGTARILNDAALSDEYYKSPGKDKFWRPDGFKDAIIQVTGKAWFRSGVGKRGRNNSAQYPIEEVEFRAR